MFRLRSRRGFTLLELIVVVVILGLLATLAIPTFAKVIARSKDAVTEQTLSAIARDAQALHAFNPDAPWSDSSIETAITETAFSAASSGAWADSTQLTPVKDTSAAATTPQDGQVVYAVDNTSSTIGLAMRSGDNVCALSADTTSILAFGCVSSSDPAALDPAQTVVENPEDITTGGTESGGDGGIIVPPVTASLTYEQNVFSLKAGLQHLAPTLTGGEGQEWAYTLEGALPPGVSFSPATGEFTGPSGWPTIASKFSIGYDHSLFLTPTGDVYGVGYSGYGQLAGTLNKTTPIKINSLSDIVDVAAGKYYSLVVNSSGQVYAFGFNNYGQLGVGSTSQKTTPTLVNISVLVPGAKIIDVEASENYSAALDDQGNVYTWGIGSNGVLGNGGTAQSTSPVKVTTAGTPMEGVKIKQISLAGYYGMVALGENGKVYTWGINRYGQLGNGTTVASSSKPVAVATSGTDMENATIVDVAAGVETVYAVDQVGNLYSWGYGSSNMLGDGTSVNRNKPARVTGPASGHTIKDVAAGSYFANRLESDGSVYSWGWNNNGELGYNNTSSQTTAVKTSAASTELGNHTLTGVTAGFSSAGAFTADGAALLWGEGSNYQLGSGNSDRTTATKASGFSSLTGWPAEVTVTATSNTGATASVTVTLEAR